MNRTTLAWAVGILLLGAALRVHEITRWSMNNDEIAEVRWSSGPLTRLIDEVRRDAVHPPLDYFVHYAIARMHGPEWLHRVPPALFGIATIATLIVLGSLWFSPAAGLVAGFLIAIAPTHVRFSQEVRPYSMGVFFLCASLAALELYARSSKRKWAISWFVFVFLAGATLYFAGMITAVVSLFRIFAGRLAIRKQLPKIIAAWTILYAPWLIVVFRLVSRESRFRPDKLDAAWWQLRVQTFGTGDWNPSPDPTSLGTWVFWAAVLIGVIIAIRRESLRTAAFWFVAGTALEIIVLQLRPHYSSPRYLMPSWPAAFVLAGAAIALMFSRRITTPVGAFVLVLFAGHSALTLQRYFAGQRSQWDVIAEYLHARAKPGEIVYVANNWADRNFDFYWKQLPRRSDVNIFRFEKQPGSYPGPVWVVTAQCSPRKMLQRRDLMARWVLTEDAHVYYIRAPRVLPMEEEICPE